MFCDELKIMVIAGDGGNGCVSFRREKYVPRGGPNGGDGGNGGNIIFKINNNFNTLYHLTSQKLYRAQNGGKGKGQNMHGKNGEDLILEVPPGTMILTPDKSGVLADLSKWGETTVIAKGGKGGLGNARFKTSTHQAPKIAEKGEPGEEKEIILELKMVADVGIIGLPSAGKSTLLSVISNARPKIADYPFTTLTPNLGVISLAKFGGSANDTFVAADIPGLIEGASEGRGLGHQFLKHITRTALIVHLIDGNLENADKNYQSIRAELKKFDKSLIEKKEIVVINKIDILTEEIIKKRLKELKKVIKTAKIFTISAITKKGLQALLFETSKRIMVIKKSQRSQKFSTMIIHKPHLNSKKFLMEKIERKKGHKIFYISGKRLEQLIVMTPLEISEGIERIYRYLEKSGIKIAVEKSGAVYGDILRIKNTDIPYRQ